jgi:hypothetical protein
MPAVRCLTKRIASAAIPGPKAIAQPRPASFFLYAAVYSLRPCAEFRRLSRDAPSATLGGKLEGP